MKTGASTHILFVFVLSFTVYELQQTVSCLKVHVEYVDEHFTPRTKYIIREAVFYVSKLLNIRNQSRNRVFRVPRAKNACLLIYFIGPNAGKCGLISREYIGIDECSGARIPPAHLEGLQVFGEDEVKPLPTSLPEGHGFTDGTNFVVYLTSRKSKLCASSLAYSQVCRMETSWIGGVLSGRPVAGIINACWNERKIDDIMIRRVVIHELMHLFGMNYKSIREFIECEGKGNTKICWKLKDIIRVTPDGGVVVRSRHLRKVIMYQKICEDGRQCQLFSDSSGCPPEACHTNNGMVLQNVTRSMHMLGGIILAKSGTGVHWSEELFDNPTSVMVPKYVKPGYVMVDPLTLALFRTSGWYSVSYNALFCLNHFLNAVSFSPNCTNLLLSNNYSTSQNETRTGEKTTPQNHPPLGNVVNVSKGYELPIVSKDVVVNETHYSTTGLDQLTQIKQQTEGPSDDRVPEDVMSDASQCSPLCVVIITIQTLFLYTTLKVIL